MDCTAHNLPHWNTLYCATLQIHPMALYMLIKCFLLLGCLTFPLKTTKTIYLCIMYKIIALFFYNLQLLNKFTSTAIVHLFKHLQWLSSALYTVFGSRISSFYGNVPAAVCMHHTGLQSLLCISNCILSHSIYVSCLGHTTQESLQITWEDDWKSSIVMRWVKMHWLFPLFRESDSPVLSGSHLKWILNQIPYSNNWKS